MCLRQKDQTHEIGNRTNVEHLVLSVQEYEKKIRSRYKADSSGQDSSKVGQLFGRQLPFYGSPVLQ